VNRLSLGVQSMDDGLLAAIGRIHSAKEAEQAVRMAREAGFENINLDLIYGLPGQTGAQWSDTLDRAIALGPQHLSCYSLILEEGTKLFADVQAGRSAPLPDEDALDVMDALTLEKTQDAGYARYEVSNYARPGCECRHNIVYWECLPYLGVGLNAHSDMDGKRFYNPEGWEDYLSMSQSGDVSRMQEGENSRESRMFERMMMGLRMIRGVDCRRFQADFGMTVQAAWPHTMKEMTRGGLIEEYNERIRLTQRGMQVMNGVLVKLMEERET